MTTARFYCNAHLEDGMTLELPGDVAHHIRVRRLREGETIILFDGKGTQAKATLTHLSKAGCHASIDSTGQISRELAGQITLVQAIASQDKMDWIIEKATELGVARLIAVQASRSVVKLARARADKRATHGRRIIESASEQCGRNQLMQLHMPHTLGEALELCRADPMFACLVEEASRSLNDENVLAQIKRQHACSIFVGPEGGWSPEEQNVLLHAGAMPVSLGKRVLRTETAGLAAVSALTALLDWDDPARTC